MNMKIQQWQNAPLRSVLTSFSNMVTFSAEVNIPCPGLHVKDLRASVMGGLTCHTHTCTGIHMPHEHVHVRDMTTHFQARKCVRVANSNTHVRPRTKIHYATCAACAHNTRHCHQPHHHMQVPATSRTHLVPFTDPSCLPFGSSRVTPHFFSPPDFFDLVTP